MAKTMATTVSHWLVGLGSIGLVAMTAIISWQIFGRFVLDSSPSWTEQASLVLMIWYVMFAAAAGVHEGFHIRIAMLEERLGKHAAMVRRFTALVVLLLGLVLLIYGAQMTWLVRETTIPSLGISRSVAYIPMPISGLLMALFALPQILDGKQRGIEDDS
ncbi:MAG: TRAP transporter small permease [Sphingopyxis sp.]|nr:TRAP transporter small permease [Sphingopyxis sp.]